jgi:hypothetical protein
VQPLVVDEIPEGEISWDRQALPMLAEGIDGVEKDLGIEVVGFQRISLSHVLQTCLETTPRQSCQGEKCPATNDPGCHSCRIHCVPKGEEGI